MSPRKTLLLAALMTLAPGALVMAQSQTMPSDTSPSSASSPSQRDSTSSSATEAPPTSDSTSPSAASTPAQRQATASKPSLKNCIAKQQSDNSGMSAADAKKACKAQMKGNSG